jgi:guanyl-specific ribonuclease Sa
MTVVYSHRLPHTAGFVFALALLLASVTHVLGAVPHTILGGGPAPSHDRAAHFSEPTEEHAALAPQKAYDLLKRLEERQGTPLPGYIGGRDFQNRERRLPRGYYREYDVNRKIRGRGRDAERIVIEQRSGKAYYTGDHYRTFVPLN